MDDDLFVQVMMQTIRLRINVIMVNQLMIYKKHQQMIIQKGH